MMYDFSTNISLPFQLRQAGTVMLAIATLKLKAVNMTAIMMTNNRWLVVVVSMENYTVSVVQFWPF